MGMLRIEFAQPSDARELATLHDAVAQEVTARLGQGHWSKPTRLERMREAIKRSDGQPNSRNIFVARESGVIVATVTISHRGMHLWKRSLWERPKEPGLAVFSLAVLPSRYRQGLGREMMHFAEEEAQRDGLRWVRLDAYTVNPDSNAFYQALGYANRGTQWFGEVGIDLYEKAMQGAEVGGPARQLPP